MSSGIFVSPEGEVLSKIKEAIGLAGSQARLSDWLGCSPDLVSLWKLKKRWIRFDFLKNISHFTGANIMNLIDGCKLRGQNVGASHDNGFIVFRKEMSSQKARVIGWVLTDGHIHSERNMITVIQKHKSMLKKLISDFQNEFGMGRSHFGIYSMNNCWRLRIGSAPLKFVFTEFYEIPAGCKYSKVRIPPSLFNADCSTKMSF